MKKTIIGYISEDWAALLTYRKFSEHTSCKPYICARVPEEITKAKRRFDHTLVKMTIEDLKGIGGSRSSNRACGTGN